MENFERKMLADALQRHNDNRSKTAEALALQRKTLQRKIKKYNL
jgi:transcriptional regulator with PAS, ATPase and Fis domain